MRNVSKLQDFALLLQGIYNQLEEKYSEHHIVEQIHFHGITQLVNQTKVLPHALAANLSENIKMTVAVEAMKKNALIELFQAFNKAGLQNNLLFKGTALAHSLYNESWLRPRTDTDLLIHKKEFNLYKKALEKQGYQQLLSIKGEYVSYQSSFVKKLSDNVRHIIDLHWKINNRQILANCLSLEELLKHSIELENFPCPIFIPNPVNSLLIAAIHRIGHHANEERLIWLYDIHLLCKALSDHQWHELHTACIKKGICGITFEALSLCKNVFSSSISDETLHKLEAASNNPEKSAFFLQRGLPEWKYFWHDLKGLNGIIEKLVLIKEHVLPNRNYMLAKTNSGNLITAYLKRFVNGCKRVFKP